MSPDPTAGGWADGACVYTTLIGGYEPLNEQPTARVSAIPYICLTDDPDLRSDTWQVRLVEPAFEMDPVRSQRDLKLRPHVHLPEMGRSLYIDNSVVLREPGERLLELVPPGVPLGVARHSFRGRVLDEFLVITEAGLDDPDRVSEQLDHYRHIAPDLLEEPVYWTGLLVRDHGDPAVRRLGDLWLAHVLRYSRRDQLSVNLALRRAGLVPHDLGLDNHASTFHSWPSRPGVARAEMGHADQAPMTIGARVAALEREVARQRRFQAAVLASRSWRLMGPARRVGGLLRRSMGTPGGAGRRRAPREPIRTALRDVVWYRSFDVVYLVRRRTRGPRWLVVGPQLVRPSYMLWKIARLLGIELVSDSGQAAPIGVRFEDVTVARHAGPSAAIVLNAGCTDISKRRVERASLAAFGYGIAVDPRTHAGPMVAKSDRNATHDGVVMEGPIAEPDPSKVYQRLLDNEIRPGVVEDLRALVVGSTIAVAYRKQRRLEERFAADQRRVTFVTPDSVFTADERSRILALTKELRADLVALDIIRDHGDGRIYVLDVNNTAFAPPKVARTPAGFLAMTRLAAAFEREWGSYLPRERRLRGRG